MLFESCEITDEFHPDFFFLSKSVYLAMSRVMLAKLPIRSVGVLHNVHLFYMLPCSPGR